MTAAPLSIVAIWGKEEEDGEEEEEDAREGNRRDDVIGCHVHTLSPSFLLPSLLPSLPTYQNIVPRAINKGDMPLQLPHLSILFKHVRSRRSLGSVIPWHAIFCGVTLKDLGVSVPWTEGGAEGGLRTRLGSPQGGREGRRYEPYPSLMVIFRSSSGLVLTVFTPLIAFTTVDFPCAT